MSFFCVHGELIVLRNKQIVWTPLRGSRDLYVLHSDSFPIKQEKDTLSLIKLEKIVCWQLSYQTVDYK